MKPSDDHRYEDQFFQFDQTWYENKYSAPRRDISAHLESDFVNDFENLDEEDLDLDEVDNDLFDNEDNEDSFYDDEAGTSPNRNL